MKLTRSAKLLAKAETLIPGGVNSPVRAFKAVGGTPPFIAEAGEATLRDVDGNRYLDYVGSWGPMILGHNHPEVVKALRRQLKRGTSYGAPTRLEVDMAELIHSLMPSIEMVRMVNSGTEATMSAVRLARAATKRDLTIKFEGCYHGHADAFLSRAGSGAATLGIPDSPGVPAAIASTTLHARYNDLATVHSLFASHKAQIAAVIVEPVVGNMGCVPPKPGFLEGLRALCDHEETLLIFDEVMTGFRVDLGGAQHRYAVRPDLPPLGKIIGGGLPVGAYGGRADLMSLIAPAGPVYQAGTLSGNPLAMSAGLATLRHLAEHPEIYEQLEERGRQLQEGLEDLIRMKEYPATFNRVGSMFTLFFNPERVWNWDDAAKCDRARFGRFHQAMLEQGIYFPPAQFEAAFISSAHTDSDIERTLHALTRSLDTAFGD